MSTFTENYNLIKPSDDDYYDVANFNENMDTIDTLMAEGEHKLDHLHEKIGEPTIEGDTIFSLLNNNSAQLVKSIQHIVHTPPKDSTSSSCTIKTVDPAKCFVIFERLYDPSNSGSEKLIYTLEASRITMTHTNVYSYGTTYGFWIVEFC